MTKTTSVNNVFNQTFDNITSGLNQVQFDTKLLFSPTLSNVYFCVNNNLQMSYNMNTTKSFDLIWNGSYLQRVDSISFIKFNLNFYVEQFIFEQTLTSLNNAIYYNSGYYNVSFSFRGNYSTTQKFNVFIWLGKYMKPLFLYLCFFKCN